MFCNLYTALITPFKNGEVDLETFDTLIDFQQKHQVKGLLVLGTTSESPTLSFDEKKSLLERCLFKNMNLMVGAGTNCTRTTIEQIEMAQSMGAHSVLIITPYYNFPTQGGIYAHFEAICEHTSLPIWLYNHPKRSGLSIEIETLSKLMNLPQIVGVKDASGDLATIQRMVALKKQQREDFLIYSGDDTHLLPYTTLGCDGLISVASNLIPDVMLDWMEHLEHNRMDQARELNLMLQPFFKALNLETNPIGIKAALNILGLSTDEMRLPLTPMQKTHQTLLKQAIINNPLIYGKAQQKHHQTSI